MTFPKRKRHKRSSNINQRTGIPLSTRKLLSILHKVKNEPEMKLYAYVNYDKHDSLVYFPTHLARYFTNANINAYARLLTRSCHRYYKTTYDEQLTVQRPQKTPVLLTITKALNFSRDDSVRMLELTSNLHPDCMCHVQSTRVIGNQIHAEMTYTYTDAPELYYPAGNTTSHPFLRVPHAGNRRAVLSKQLHLSTYPLALQRQMLLLFDTHDELVFTMKLKVVFTFNPHMDRIVHIVRTNVQNSVQHKNITYTLS